MAGSHNAPPESLDRDLEVGPEDFKERDFYQMMTALVALVNRGWVSPLVWATAAVTIWSGLHYGISFRRRLNSPKLS